MLIKFIAFDLSRAYNNRSEGDPNWSGDIVYTKPWCRIQTYLVGMLLGYAIYNLEGRSIKLKKVILFLFLCFVVVVVVGGGGGDGVLLLLLLIE